MLQFGLFLLGFGPHCLDMGFLAERTEGRTDGRTDGGTDRRTYLLTYLRTHPLIESLSKRLKRQDHLTIFF